MRDKLVLSLGSLCAVAFILLAGMIGYHMGSGTTTPAPAAEASPPAPAPTAQAMTPEGSITIPGFDKLQIAASTQIYCTFSGLRTEAPPVTSAPAQPSYAVNIPATYDTNTTPVSFGYIVANTTADDTTIDGTYTGTIYFTIEVQDAP